MKTAFIHLKKYYYIMWRESNDYANELQGERYGNCPREDKCDRTWENQPVSEKNKFLFLLLWCLLRRAKMPPSKFEANPTLRRGVKSASFSLFTLAFVHECVFLRVRNN